MLSKKIANNYECGDDIKGQRSAGSRIGRKRDKGISNNGGKTNTQEIRYFRGRGK